MRVQEKVTRRRAGVNDTGEPVFETIRHGVPRVPESVPEWLEQRAAALGAGVRGRAPGELLLAVLEAAAADPGGAQKALLDGGRDLTERQRYGVLKTLDYWRDATGYAAGMALAREWHRAWVRRFGDQPPPQVV